MAEKSVQAVHNFYLLSVFEPIQLCEVHSWAWADVNCNVFFFFFLRRESGMVRLNWSKLARHLSSVGMIVPPSV